ncbi:MAG TPA: hypothetical protein VGS01_09610 [Candidatus Limnocylindria bacterium]|jgi:hypothetical protein|nr:hypothetical protein [Candidatus Limnocylindria bacterium]
MAKAAREFDLVEMTAYAWWSLSAFPRERGIAARRFRDLEPRFVDDRVVFLAIIEYAAERRPASCSRCQRIHVGYHAVGISEQVLRDRYGRIQEAQSAIDKAEENDIPVASFQPARGLRSMTEVLADVMPRFGPRGRGSE